MYAKIVKTLLQMNFNSLVIKQNKKQADKPKYVYEDEFHNSLVRLRFLCLLTDIKIAWKNFCILGSQLKSFKNGGITSRIYCFNFMVSYL